MSTHWKATLATALCAAAFSRPGLAQVAPPTILEIDVENPVQYFEDTSDLPSLRLTQRDNRSPTKKLRVDYIHRDIVAVNGQPAKGTFTRNLRQVFLNPVPSPGQAIADSVRNAVTADTFEILKNDRTPIGTIVSYGLTVGSPPLGRLCL